MIPQLPLDLIPKAVENIAVQNLFIEIPRCTINLIKWDGEPIHDTFGGKPLVSVENKPMFAELAIMTLFANDNWDTRWIEVYGKSTPVFLSEWKDDKYKNQIHHPFDNKDPETLLQDIASKNRNSYSGCWDILAFKDNNIVFAECKRRNRDKIRPSQINWLSAGLNSGLTKDNFLVVEWDMNAADRPH